MVDILQSVEPPLRRNSVREPPEAKSRLLTAGIATAAIPHTETCWAP